MKRPLFSVLLVGFQFSAIAYFIWVSGGPARTAAGPWVQAAAIILALAAIGWMRLANLAIFPEPKAASRLVRKGPYRIIRHPMYTAVLLFCAAYLPEKPRILNAAVFLLLLAVLIMKLKYEESLLRKRFPEYNDYCRKTWRLIPFLY